MVGATKNADGSSGIVPTPVAGDHNKFLRGDGTWAVVDLSELQSVVTTFIGSDTGKTARPLAAAMPKGAAACGPTTRMTTKTGPAPTNRET